jgi:hypothetical protein
MATTDRLETEPFAGMAWGEIAAAWLLAGLGLLVLWAV